MNQEYKKSYLEKENEQLKRELKDRYAEIRALEKELREQNDRAKDREEAYEKLCDQYDRYLFEQSERIEQATEARIAYEQALADVKKLQAEYREGLRKIKEAVKDIGKAV